MANREHLKILKQGVDTWNRWRSENPEIEPNLSRAKLSEVDLKEVNFCKVNLLGAELFNTNLCKADLSHADLSATVLVDANLSKANVNNADLTYAQLVGANFEGAILTNCSIYGIAAWDIKGKPLEQADLVITPFNEPTITVDNLEVAQFIYLLLYNEKIRHVIDTITSKVVLILGRFTAEQKAVLDAIKDELRKCDYLPVMFDFEKPASRDLTETISTLAHLSRFIIVDITDPRSVPQELQAIIPNLRSVPVQPLLQASATEYSMFKDFGSYPWVLEIYRYDNREVLLASFKEKVIIPAEAKVKEIRKDGSWK